MPPKTALHCLSFHAVLVDAEEWLSPSSCSFTDRLLFSLLHFATPTKPPVELWTVRNNIGFEPLRQQAVCGAAYCITFRCCSRLVFSLLILQPLLLLAPVPSLQQHLASNCMAGSGAVGKDSQTAKTMAPGCERTDIRKNSSNATHKLISELPQ